MDLKHIKNSFIALTLAASMLSLSSCARTEGSADRAAVNYSVARAGVAGAGEIIADKDSSYYLYAYLPVDNTRLSYGNLILVNRSASFSRDISDERVSLLDCKNDCYLLRDDNITASKTCVDALNVWTGAFAEATGLKNIVINSGFRSVEYQQQLIEEMNVEYGEEYTTLVAAPPTKSEHHTGLGIDLCVYENGEYVAYSANGPYAWFLDNARYFGFVQRYKSSKTEITQVVNENWHFRYVGTPHAEIMELHDFCLEEYIEYLRQFTFDGDRLRFTSGDGTEYEIYFVAAQTGDDTYVPVPLNRSYTLSGNNVDGYIVTVAL